MYPPSGVIRPQPLMGWMDPRSCLGCDSDDHDETEVCTERSLAVNSRCPPNGADTSGEVPDGHSAAWLAIDRAVVLHNFLACQGVW